MSSTESTTSNSSPPDPNPEQRIFHALLAGVPIKVNILLKSIQDWDIFATEFRAICRQHAVSPYIFEGLPLPTEPTPPPIPCPHSNTSSPSHLDILLFEVKLCMYNHALREYNTTMDNLDKIHHWLMIHVSQSLYHICSPNFDKEMEHQTPGLWYSNLRSHIVAPHEEKMALELARSKYRDHFLRLRKRRSVSKRYLGRWLEGLGEILREGQLRGVPEAVDARRWFGDLVRNGVIDAAYGSLGRVAMVISEVDGKIKRGDVEVGDVIYDILMALEGDGVDSIEGKGSRDVSFVDEEGDGEDISPGTGIAGSGAWDGGLSGQSQADSEEKEELVLFEDIEVGDEGLSTGVGNANPRTRKGSSSEIEPCIPRGKDVFEGDTSGTERKSFVVRHSTEGSNKGPMEGEAPQKKKEVSFKEPKVGGEAKNGITVVEEKKATLEEYHSCEKGDEEKGAEHNDEEAQGKKKKSLRAWLRRVGGRARTLVQR